MTPLLQCNHCNWQYPDHLLSSFSSTRVSMTNVCGICALVLSNYTLGIMRTEFTGKVAEQKRQLAITWRKQHPDLAPKGRK